MEILIALIVLGMILFGAFGVFLPAIPGPLVAWSGLLVCRLAWPEGPIDTTTLVFCLILVLIAKGFDFIASIFGARWYGASWAGAIGAVIGGFVFTLVGLFFGPGVIIGAILGPAIGAFLAEWIFGKTWKAALKAGWGTFVGFVLSIALNLFVCGIFLTLFVFLCILRLWNSGAPAELGV